MPPNRNSDERRFAGQSMALAFAAAVLGCQPAAPAQPDGGTSMNGDAGSADAAAIDATSGDGGGGGGEDAMVDGGGLPRTCVTPASADPSGTDMITDELGQATVSIDDRTACQATWTLSSTAMLRDSMPGSPRTVVEQAGWPTTRTGNDMFDALHALAMEEAGQLSVSTIRDGAFENGSAIDCGGCFETGRLWTYVWTRDTSFATDLGMAAIDPARARASLEFKLSERRGGGNLQVVQDTGSGGSYPVSSDRVAWALGAQRLLAYLDGADRDAFQGRAYEALRNTVEHDRNVVYDASDGLYFGETSFLDWREQTYPEWTADDPVQIAMSKALGTNLLHLRALEVVSGLATEAGDTNLAGRYSGWADALRTAIQTKFWLDGEGLFSTFIPTTLDPAPVRRYDLLGSAFAVIFGVASDAQAQRVLASYPHYGPGAPVIFPEQQNTPIYHNRAEWPFVSAYWLRAAKKAANDAVADRMVGSLMRHAALNLSNMEALDADSGAAWVDDGANSGPVVSSQRQLWSVAGYLSMVHHSLFGLEAEADGLHVRPYLTHGMREGMFAGTDTLVLNDFPWHGRSVSVVLHLPAVSGATGGSLDVGSITLNGAAVSGNLLPEAMLDDRNRVDVTLVDGATAASLTEVSSAEWQQVYGPKTPRISTLSEVGGRLQLALDPSGEAAGDVTFTVYRDGMAIATNLAGNTASWTDPDTDPGGASSPCYVVETTFTASGNHSQHSPAVCWWGRGNAHITSVDASAMANVGGSGSSDHGRFHYEPWGDPGHSLTVSSFTASATGPHLLQVTYGNGAGPINTGITCAIKRIVVEDAATGATVAEGPVVMPQLGTWDRWTGSSFVPATLTAGHTYRIVIRGDDEMVNMSVFAHFQRYTGGLGGASGEYDRVNIADLKVFVR